jgi:hypothetical protein
MLYNAVCEPVIRRAQLLLQLAPASIATVTSHSAPMKLLPGISVPSKYGMVDDDTIQLLKLRFTI